MHPRYHVPARSIALVSIIIILLSLINIGSSIALNAILSLSTLGLYISYLLPISLLLLRRFQHKHIERGPFCLGKLGIWVNIYALVYGIFIVIFLPFPVATSVTAASMNYAGPVFIGLVLIALLDWLLRGRNFYDGPVREVRSTSDANMAADVPLSEAIAAKVDVT